MLKRRQGFTLIELLIVVVIIGILAAIAIPKFSSAREKAYFSTMKSDLKNLASQQEVYYATDGEYAYSMQDMELGFAQSEGMHVDIFTATAQGWAATATHEALEAGLGCAVYYGEVSPTPTDPTAPSQAGVIACIDEL